MLGMTAIDDQMTYRAYRHRNVNRNNSTRRAFNGIFWILHLGTVARSAGQLPSVHHLLQWLRSLGRTGVWTGFMGALAGHHDAGAHMFDPSIARVHQHDACTRQLPPLRAYRA
jgi:hypothetical protein